MSHPVLEVMAEGESGTSVTWMGKNLKYQPDKAWIRYPSMLNSVVIKGLSSRGIVVTDVPLIRSRMNSDPFSPKRLDI